MFIKKIKNRMKGGWVYNRHKNNTIMFTKLVKENRHINNKGMFRHLKYTDFLMRFYGKKREHLEVESIKKNFVIKEDSVFGVNTDKGTMYIPIPEEGYIICWDDELIDLIVPYAFYDMCDYSYSCIEHAFHEGPYELNENVCVSKGDIVIDCGANMGIFSAVASLKEAEKIYAFEPTREVIDQYLNNTVKYNNNIEICEFALSDTEGVATFYLDDATCSASSLYNDRERSTSKSVEVQMTTIDSFVEKNNIKHVDFIKADIEGAERSMLRGATRVLKEMAPKLAICTYHYPEDKQLLESIIKEANPNYVVEHKYKKLYAYVPK